MNSNKKMMVGPVEEVENEWHIVRHSGETPEIAYNAAIYYLTRAKDGPHLSLDEAQIAMLKEAAVERYTEIILRDLQHDNCDKSIYRGIDRSIINYRRFCVFCARQQVLVTGVRHQTAKSLVRFLDIETARLQSGRQSSIINCSYKDLQDFALELGVELPGRYGILEKHCLYPA